MLVFIFMLTTVIYCCAATLNKAFEELQSAFTIVQTQLCQLKLMVFTKSKMKPQTLPCIVTMQIEYKRSNLQVLGVS